MCIWFWICFKQMWGEAIITARYLMPAIKSLKRSLICNQSSYFPNFPPKWIEIFKTIWYTPPTQAKPLSGLTQKPQISSQRQRLRHVTEYDIWPPAATQSFNFNALTNCSPLSLSRTKLSIDSCTFDGLWNILTNVGGEYKGGNYLPEVQSVFISTQSGSGEEEAEVCAHEGASACVNEHARKYNQRSREYAALSLSFFLHCINSSPVKIDDQKLTFQLVITEIQALWRRFRKCFLGCWCQRPNDLYGMFITLQSEKNVPRWTNENETYESSSSSTQTHLSFILSPSGPFPSYPISAISLCPRSAVVFFSRIEAEKDFSVISLSKGLKLVWHWLIFRELRALTALCCCFLCVNGSFMSDSSSHGNNMQRRITGNYRHKLTQTCISSSRQRAIRWVVQYVVTLRFLRV